MKRDFICLKMFLVSIFMIIPLSSSSANDNFEILLKSRQFTPQAGITFETKTKIESISGRAHVLIQLERIPTVDDINVLENEGVQLLSYIPNNAWFSSIPSDSASEIAALSIVRSICEILPEDKISPTIKEGVDAVNLNPDETVNLAIVFFGDVSLNDAENIFLNYGGIVYGSSTVLNTLLITIPKEKITDLQNEDIIKWITGALIVPTTCNDGSRSSIGVNIVQATPYNLTGLGVAIGEWDSGWVDTTHDDLQGRVTIGDSGSSTGDHATHVAGTMLGDGSRSEAEGGTPYQWRGMATSATVISYEWWDNVGELNAEYDSAINTYGIVLSTNSWGLRTAYYGCGIMGDYLLECSALDNVIFGSRGKSIPIVWAAGNERADDPYHCGYYGYTYGTITPYGTTKNTITVGAIYSDLDETTCFSSWGPTDDGRIKPDVVAPGDKTPCYGLGIKSTVPGNTYDDQDWVGTSMAAPAVAGSVALMLEDWRNTHIGRPDPLPSTIKAILLQTSVDLGNTGPDYSYGYGKINVKDAIDLIREDVNSNVIFEGSITEQNYEEYYTIDVPAGRSELKLTLVWDDYPADPAAAKSLVNDLDLIVKGPDGTRYYPYILNPSNPSAPSTRGEDNLNNVEQVCIDNPVSGLWTIEVSGVLIPEPVQKYSLVGGPLKVFSFDFKKVDDVNDGDCVVPGKAIKYTIQYGNPVTDPCEPGYIGTINDVSITDFLPKELKFISASGNGNYDPYSHTVKWDIGTLEPNQSGVFTLNVKLDFLGCGVITNRCEIKIGDVSLGALFERVPVCCVGAPGPAAGGLGVLDVNDVNKTINLTWCRGRFAADVNGHEVYFGTDFKAVSYAFGSADLTGDDTINCNDLDILCRQWLTAGPEADIFPEGNPDGIVVRSTPCGSEKNVIIPANYC